MSSGAARLATTGMLVTILGGLCIGLALGLAPRAGVETALALDGVTRPRSASLTPHDQLSAVARTPENAEKVKGLTALQYAADQGHPAAQWKLGRMYADGDGVARNELRAFDYFSRIANSDAEEPPGTPQARIAADAFVALGRYYLNGIANSAITPDPARAHRMFAYAASYFGDADAQYELGRLYLAGKPSDAHEAARWFLLAATKGHCRAEVALGDLLSRGQYVPRQAARGLMWLTLGRDCAGADEAWMKPLYDNAFSRASDHERVMALVYLKDWMNGRRD